MRLENLPRDLVPKQGPEDTRFTKATKNVPVRGLSSMGSALALLFSSGLIVQEVLTELGFLVSFRVIGSEVIEDWCLTTQSQEAIITVTS